MPVIDIVIGVAFLISVVVGLARGLVKEAMSVTALLIAIWAAFNLGGKVGALSADWFSSAGVQLWFGRVLVFVVVLAIGGLLSWSISRLVRLSVLSGMDRILGMVFGFARAVVLGGVFVLAGQYASFDQDSWWRESRVIPLLTEVGDWLEAMAPRGVELLQTPADAPAIRLEPPPDGEI